MILLSSSAAKAIVVGSRSRWLSAFVPNQRCGIVCGSSSSTVSDFFTAINDVVPPSGSGRSKHFSTTTSHPNNSWSTTIKTTTTTNIIGISSAAPESVPAARRTTTTTLRYFSGVNNNKQGNNNNKNDDDLDDDSKFDHLPRLESANPDRIKGIIVNPASVGSKVLPGNLVYKKYKWSGNVRKIPLELEHGYFWMLWDLRNTQNKPTLSNESLIPVEEAQLFPTLKGLTTLSGKNDNDIDLPFFFIDQHKDPMSPKNCTLVAISFRDSGFKHIPTWMKPFSIAYKHDPNVQMYTISITERWSLYPLKGMLSKLMRQNTPQEEHDSTLLYFGSFKNSYNVDEFRDVLRMHNIMTNYIFLLDHLGRIRFAASGPVTSDEEIANLIRFTKQLTNNSSNNQGGGSGSGKTPRQGGGKKNSNRRPGR